MDKNLKTAKEQAKAQKRALKAATIGDQYLDPKIDYFDEVDPNESYIKANEEMGFV
jgi:hypothetical protein